MTITDVKNRLIKDLNCKEEVVLKYLKKENYNLEDHSLNVDYDDYEFLKISFQAELELFNYIQEEHQKHLEEMEEEQYFDELAEKSREEDEKWEQRNKYDSTDYGHHDSTYGWDKSNKWNID